MTQNVNAGATYPIENAGAPTNGTNEVQTLTIGGTPTGGTFRLSFDGFLTSAISWSATNNTLIANVDTALEALPNIGTGGVTTADSTLSSGIGDLTITFTGNNARKSVSLIAVPSAHKLLTGSAPTVAVARTTAGVDATARGAGASALLIDTTNRRAYQNRGTALIPVWTLLTPMIVLSETVGFAAFTDGGGATGTFTFTAGSIPIGAYAMFTSILVPAGFAGNVSATIQVGDGSDVDRYTTGTPSVFATAADGIDAGVPSGVRFHATAKTPVITITASSDFTAVNAGSVTVSIYYIPTV